MPIQQLKARYKHAYSQNKRMTIMVTILVLVFGGIIGFNAFKALMIKRFFATFQPPPVSVHAVVVEKTAYKPEITAVGTFKAIHGVDVSTQANGKIVKILFKSGQFVEEGTELLNIDDTVDQATLKQSRSQLALQQVNYKRQTDLFKRGATPVSSLDEAKANLEQAAATVERNEAEIAYKHIRAPFTGKLGISQINLGQFIQAGDVIVSLQAMDPLWLNFYVPENLLQRVHTGQEVTFSIDSVPNTRFVGKVTAINSKIDETSHNVLIQATVPNCPSEAGKPLDQNAAISVKVLPGGERQVTCDSLKNLAAKTKDFLFTPGMFAKVSVLEAAQNDVIMVPTTAISFSIYGDAVYKIVEEQDPNDKAKKQLVVKRVYVKIGEQQNTYTVVTEGLQAGDKVVSFGELKLRNGARVVITPDETKPEQPKS